MLLKTIRKKKIWQFLIGIGLAIGCNAGEPSRTSFTFQADELAAANAGMTKKSVEAGSRKTPVWIFDGKRGKTAVSGKCEGIPAGYKGMQVEIAVLSVADETVSDFEDVYRVRLVQKHPESGEVVTKFSGPPVRTRLTGRPMESRTILLESCCPVKPDLPISFSIERCAGDFGDTFKHDTGLVSATFTPVRESIIPFTVESRPGYNSWPMMQADGNKLVCTYSRGSAHVTSEPKRNVYVRSSVDFGKTWSPEAIVTADTVYGEVPIGKGLDENGKLLFWVRRQGIGERRHDLYRTADGVHFEYVVMPELDPVPMQITDVFHVPTVGLMALWFTGNYGAEKLNAWGTLVSRDNGDTWTQYTVEDALPHKEWMTEPSAVYLGNGRIFAVGRIEYSPDSAERAQFQMESEDYGKTWKRSKTNITDVMMSTPSLIYDRETGLVSNYYYQRGRGMLKRRVAKIDEIWGKPLAWPDPEIIVFGDSATVDAGNVNATAIGRKHYLAYYSGETPNTSVLVAAVPAPAMERRQK